MVTDLRLKYPHGFLDYDRSPITSQFLARHRIHRIADSAGFHIKSEGIQATAPDMMRLLL